MLIGRIFDKIRCPWWHQGQMVLRGFKQKKQFHDIQLQKCLVILFWLFGWIQFYLENLKVSVLIRKSSSSRQEVKVVQCSSCYLWLPGFPYSCTDLLKKFPFLNYSYSWLSFLVEVFLSKMASSQPTDICTDILFV